jgi:predicted HTH domain antitoxin
MRGIKLPLGAKIVGPKTLAGRKCLPAKANNEFLIPLAMGCILGLDVTLTIPNERLGNVALDEKDALVDIAIGLYKRQSVSLGRAAEIAGISSVELLNELGRRQIPINYGVDELREDVAAFGKPS